MLPESNVPCFVHPEGDAVATAAPLSRRAFLTTVGKTLSGIALAGAAAHA